LTSLNAFLDNASNVRYTGLPDLFGTGVDSITVNVRDNGNTGIGGGGDVGLGVASVNINPANDEQILVLNNPGSVVEGSVVVVDGSLLRTIDVDNIPTELVCTVTGGPGSGSLLLSGLGTSSFTQADLDAARVTYQHDGSETLSDAIAFSVDDGQGTASTGVFNVNINPVNDAPITADSLFSAAAGNRLIVSSPGVLATATDAEGDALSTVMLVAPSHGKLTINANGSFEYTPDFGYVGTDSFDFSADDGNASSAPSTVAIEIFAAAPSGQGSTSTTTGDGGTVTVTMVPVPISLPPVTIEALQDDSSREPSSDEDDTRSRETTLREKPPVEFDVSVEDGAIDSLLGERLDLG